jgi:hypothetical protein
LDELGSWLLVPDLLDWELDLAGRVAVKTDGFGPEFAVEWAISSDPIPKHNSASLRTRLCSGNTPTMNGRKVVGIVDG